MTHRSSRSPIRRDVLAASLIINVLGVGLPIVLLQVYDRVIPREAVGTLVLLCTGLLVATLLDLALRLARDALLGWAGARFEHRLRMALLDHALRCDLRVFERDSPGGHLDRLAGVDRLRDLETGEGATAAVDLPFVLVYAAVLAWISPLLALVPLAVIALAWGVGRVTGPALERLAAERARVDARRFSFIVEVLRTLETVKSLGVEAFMQRRYERLMRTAAVVGRGLAVTSGVAQGVTGLLLQVTTVGTAGVGALLVVRGELTTGALAAALLLAGRTVQPALRVQALASRGRQGDLWRGDIAAFLATPRPEPASLAPGPLATIALEGATLRSGDGRVVLDAVDLTVRAGETVLVRGRNGSGKSALMWLLSAAVPPDEGRLLVDGVDARRYDPALLRGRIALLTQRSGLLPGTVGENLTRFDLEGRLDSAVEVSSALGLDRYFAERPDGLSADVSETGSAELPASVANAVTIVRGLSGSPSVVLFDEANATLDAAMDRRFLAYLRSIKDRTALVLVTHRPSYEALADRIYRLEDGRLLPEAREADAGLVGAGAVA